MRPRLLVFFIFFVTNYLTGKCLRLVEVKVPSVVDPREEKVLLYCNYELDKGEKLYSVKWSKDGDEFYRFMPDAKPPGVDFHVDGIQVSITDSTDKIVTLIQPPDITNYETSGLAGSYGCEVVTDTPNFPVKFDVANMSIAVLPQRDPVLEGTRTHYNVGDTLDAQCTSAPSFPPAELSFHLDNIEIKKDVTSKLPDVGIVGGNVISMTRLGLSLTLSQRNFNPSGNFILTCRSILPGIPGVKPRETSAIILLASNNVRLAQEASKVSSSSSSAIKKNYFYCSSIIIIISIITTKF